MFGENLQLTRLITAKLGEKRLFIHDTVENMGAKPSEHMMLYHINIGFPAVNDAARLIAPTLSAQPRDAEAEKGKERYANMQPPQLGFREKVYFHTLATDANGQVTTAIVDDETDSGGSDGPGFGVYCAYSPAQLPRFTEWKMLDSGTYVVGMEPANCSVLGRAAERDAGTLTLLAPGEQRHYDLEIGVLSGKSEIEHLASSCRAIVTAAQNS